MTVLECHKHEKMKDIREIIKRWHIRIVRGIRCHRKLEVNQAGERKQSYKERILSAKH